MDKTVYMKGIASEDIRCGEAVIFDIQTNTVRKITQEDIDKAKIKKE